MDEGWRGIFDSIQDNFWRCYENTIKLSINRNEYKWLTRAILQKHNILNDEEIKEFFSLMNCVTFCHLRINFVEREEQQTMNLEFYFLFLKLQTMSTF